MHLHPSFPRMRKSSSIDHSRAGLVRKLHSFAERKATVGTITWHQPQNAHFRSFFATFLLPYHHSAAPFSPRFVSRLAGNYNLYSGIPSQSLQSARHAHPTFTTPPALPPLTITDRRGVVGLHRTSLRGADHLSGQRQGSERGVSLHAPQLRVHERRSVLAKLLLQ